jgi:hypothetical protein
MNFTGRSDDPDQVKRMLRNLAGAFDDAREKRAAKEAYKSKAKKKSETKGELTNLKKDVVGTYLFKGDFKPELEYMKDKLKEIESKIKGSKKSKKSDKSDTVKDLKKLYKKVKDTKMVSSFKPELDSMKEKLKEINTLLKKPKKELKTLVKANEEHLKVFPSMKDKEEQKMTKKILTAKSDYTRDLSKVSTIVKNFVDEYKHILDNVSKKGGAQTKRITKIRSKLYENAMPSDIRDALALVKELKKDYVEEEKPKKKYVSKAGSAKSKAVKPDKDDDDAEYDKRIKHITKYIKNKIDNDELKPLDDDTINYIGDEVISKKIKRLSVKIIQSIIDE